MRPRVLFVYLHGSAKSLIAAEYFQRMASARGVGVDADFGGLEPDDAVPPRVVRGLGEDGIDVRGHRPRRPTPDEIGRARAVVAFCDLGDLASHAKRVDRWDDVPAVSEDFARARDAIVARISGLLEDASLRG